MFTDMVESVASKKKTHKGWAVTVSILFQLAGLIILILIPLIYTEALPKAIFNTVLIAPGAPEPSPAPTDATLHKSSRRTTRSLDGKILHAPSVIPTSVVTTADFDFAPDAPTTVGSVLGFDFFRASTNPTIPPPPAPVQQETRATRIRLGGQVQAAKIVSQPQPAYPTLARQAGIQGNVVLHAIIGKDGSVSELQVISGHPLLVKAAVDSVKQWRYQPTLLNKQPVEVDTTITVTFLLG